MVSSENCFVQSHVPAVKILSGIHPKKYNFTYLRWIIFDLWSLNYHACFCKFISGSLFQNIVVRSWDLVPKIKLFVRNKSPSDLSRTKLLVTSHSIYRIHASLFNVLIVSTIPMSSSQLSGYLHIIFTLSSLLHPVNHDSNALSIDLAQMLSHSTQRG